jgi:hypothetical protein
MKAGAASRRWPEATHSFILASRRPAQKALSWSWTGRTPYVSIGFRFLRIGSVFLAVACGAGSAPDDSAAGSGNQTSGPIDTSLAGSSSFTGNSAGKTAPPAASGGSAAAQSGGTGAVSGSTGTSAAAGGSATAGAGAAGRTAGSGTSTGRFSFFVASYAALQRLSGSPNGFGGDLRFGQADGLAGADEICRQIAGTALPGAGAKTWRAFLSATQGADGKPVNAIDRVGNGPWYDRLGRLVAMTKADLAQERPKGADSAIINDLPNEDGVGNHAPDGSMQVDNHDVLTGSSATGTLYGSDWSVTCHDWTSSVGSDGKPRVGHSWPRMGGGNGGPMGGGGGGGMNNWMSALNEAGCAAGASLVEMGGPMASNPTVGSGGGYGAIYCFALTP